MSLLHVVLLALVQGITEFLPISSSGHLILVPALTGWRDQGPMIDVAVHVGTLVAVIVYFRRDLAEMAMGLFPSPQRKNRAGSRLAVNLVVATVPVVIAGTLIHGLDLGERLRSIEVVGWATLVFGFVLLAADRLGMTLKRIEHMAVGGALIIGLAQVLALIPGTSRSGITMTAARMLGYERQDAARFSLLLSIPTIIAAGTLGGIEIYQTGDVRLQVDALFAALLSCVIAFITIAALMAWLGRATFLPFVVYRTALGVVLLVWAYN